MVLNNKQFSTKNTSKKNLTARGTKILLFFFEKRKERRALRPFRNTDKELLTGEILVNGTRMTPIG
jgi:hypothetical protein